MWRNLGRRGHAGNFEPAISFLEAINHISHEQLTVFLELDAIYSKMERQYIKQTKGTQT